MELFLIYQTHPGCIPRLIDVKLQMIKTTGFSFIFGIIHQLLLPKTISPPKRGSPVANQVSVPTRCQEETQNPAKQGYQAAAINGLHSLTDSGAEEVFHIPRARCVFPHFHVLKIKAQGHLPVLTHPFLKSFPFLLKCYAGTGLFFSLC